VVLYLSTGAFAEPDLPAMLAECATLGAGLEFTANLAPAPDWPARIAAARSPAVPLLVHNYFPPPAAPFVLNLAATDPAIRNASLALARAAIDLTAAIAAPFYSVHSGFAMNLSADQLGRPETQAALAIDHLIDRDTALTTFRESVRELSRFATDRGVTLLLENNVVTATQAAAGRADTLLLTSPRECRQFLDDLADPTVGLLLDVAHARVAATALGFDPAAFFTVCAPHIRGLHLSDNDGQRDSNQPFTADAWFAPALRDLRDCPMVIEVYRLDQNARAAQLTTLRTLLA